MRRSRSCVIIETIFAGRQLYFAGDDMSRAVLNKGVILDACSFGEAKRQFGITFAYT